MIKVIICSMLLSFGGGKVKNNRPEKPHPVSSTSRGSIEKNEKILLFMLSVVAPISLFVPVIGVPFLLFTVIATASNDKQLNK